MKPKKGEEYDVKTVPFITNIPINTIKLEINATVMDDDTDETFTVGSKMSAGVIREGMIAGDEWDFKNTKYVLSDEYLENLE